eukprot:jgi/Botrbrau1/15098/Bobra.0255s0010.2
MALRRPVSRLHKLAVQAQACWGDRVRSYAAEPAQGDADEDLVLQSFREQQKQLRGFLDGFKSIDVPLDGDAKKVQKFANDVEALKKKLNIPPPEGVWRALLNYKARVAKGDPRKFLSAALEGVDPGPYSALLEELEGAITEAETEHGSLELSNKKGWDAFAKKIDVRSPPRLSLPPLCPCQA